MKTISFVIAVYRNAGSIRPAYEQLRQLFAGPLQSYNYEFVFVDDGSDDGSLQELLALREHDPRILILSLSRNFGQIAAVIAGFRHATGDAVINQAADQQEPVATVLEFVKEWEKGNQVVIGHRISREDTWAANVLGNLYWRLLQLANPQLPPGSDFFLLDRQAVGVFNNIEESDRFFPVDVVWLGFNPKIVPYRRLKRTIGKSQWRLSKKVKAGIDGLLHRTYLPIRLISLCGVTIAVSGVVAAGGLVVHKLIRGSAYPGWHSIACLLLLLNGLVITMLGIIGEYVWRIYNQAKGRPVYIIRRKFG